MRAWSHLSFGVALVLAVGCFPPALPRPDADVTDDTGDTDDANDTLEVDTISEVDGRVAAPSGLVASVDRGDDVELTWSSPAERFRVYRCDSAPCLGAWVELTTEPVPDRRFRDTSVTAPALPAAPAPKTENDNAYVEVTWDAIAAPEARRYTYRVTALDEEARESAPSNEVVGHRAERPVVRYEIVVDDGPWLEVGLTTSWTDLAAGAPTLSVGQVVASQGTFTAYVELVATGTSASPGAMRRYTVRAVTAYGPGPSSSPVEGRRAAPTVALQWQRSVDATADVFEDLATGAVVQDTSAPADGSARLYRVVLRGNGAETVVSAAVTGWRQPPPGVPGGLIASTELSDRVKLSWQAVSEAIGYHVYRGEQKLTSGNGITATTFEDFDTAAPGAWAAASGLTASTQRTDGIEVSWVAPSRPVGATVSYSVSAVNASGEGLRSASVSGRRAAPALDRWEVEVGGTRTEVVSSVSWLDEDAPFAHIAMGSATATQGDHRAFVRLSHSGGAVTPAAIASYRVRGRLVGGGGTPWSAATEGRRAHGAVSRRWQRSAGESAEGFTDVATVATAIHEDTTASDLGEKRWYRVVVAAAGALSQTVGPVQGWRLAFSRLGSLSGFAVSTDGHVWSWSSEAPFLVTVEPSSVVGVGRLLGFEDVVSVAIGESHVCVVTQQGRVLCGGWNTFGEIGDGTQIDRPVAVPVGSLTGIRGVTAGYSVTCADSANRVWCWGSNELGEVGANSNELQFVAPTPVRTSNNVVLSNVALLAEVAGFGYTRCAVLSTAQVYCWGTPRLSPTWRAATLQLTLPSVPRVLAGDDHAWCAVMNTGAVQCWGAGADGQLGHGAYVDFRADAVPVELSDVVDLSSNGRAVCAITQVGAVWCWGDNFGGRLGLPLSTTRTHTPQEVPGLSGITDIVVDVFGETCAIQRGGIVCWGNGTETPREIQFP